MLLPELISIWAALCRVTFSDVATKAPSASVAFCFFDGAGCETVYPEDPLRFNRVDTSAFDVGSVMVAIASVLRG